MNRFDYCIDSKTQLASSQGHDSFDHLLLQFFTFLELSLPRKTMEPSES